MSTITVFYIKLLLVIASSVGVWWSANAQGFWERLEKQQKGNQVIGLGILLFRLLPFVGIYVLLNFMPRGDVPFFWGKASVAYQGGMVYRDIVSYHAPLFTYIITLPLWLWYSSKAIVLLMVLVEAAIIWGTYHTYRKFDARALQSIAIYLILSAPMVMVLLGGQEDIWIWGIAVWMLYYYHKTQNDGLPLGVRFSVGLIVIKATFGFWLFPLWLLLKKRWGFLLGMSLVGIPTLALLYSIMGLDFLMPLQMTTNLLTPNLFTIARPLLTAMLGHAPPLSTFSWIGVLVTLSTAMWVTYPAQRWSLTRSLPIAFLSTFIAMTIFQATSPGYYTFTYMLPLVLEVVDWKKSKDVFILLFFNAVLVVQPFLFTHLGSPTYDDASILTSPLYLLEYTLQILNVVCYGWYFIKIYQKARGSAAH
ncbi:hypothetical protein [Runella zeae]|uniref:hypothetical protein n=1 Tax=Runella zeae TaxID=94255 RepID=UPI000427B63A|nr:hypothetical protein [Runella zeae]